MADKHPYVSGTGVLIQVLDHLRKSFPAKLDAEILRKLGYAPKNESYIINTVRFIKLIGEDGTRTAQAQKAFTLHDPASFTAAFSDLVKSAYADLFALHGDDAWVLDSTKLITFFRQTDQSSELVGTLQANTFKALVAYAGHGGPAATPKPKAKQRAAGKPKPPPKPVIAVPAPRHDAGGGGQYFQNGRTLGLTVRIEINLPATGDQDTYDKIFKSIRENLLNG